MSPYLLSLRCVVSVAAPEEIAGKSETKKVTGSQFARWPGRPPDAAEAVSKNDVRPVVDEQHQSATYEQFETPKKKTAKPRAPPPARRRWADLSDDDDDDVSSPDAPT